NIEANPQNYYFLITTGDAPNGALAGTLVDANTQTLTGTLTNSVTNGRGTYTVSLSPNAGGASYMLSYDILTRDIGNLISSISLGPNGGVPNVTLGNNTTADNGRLLGALSVTAAQAQQILGNPGGFNLTVNPLGSGGPLSGTLSQANEIFIPVA